MINCGLPDTRLRQWDTITWILFSVGESLTQVTLGMPEQDKFAKIQP